MTIHLNGEPRTCTDSLSVATLLDELGFKGQPVLVECNGEPIHKRNFDSTTLNEGDKIELIRIVAGG
jgi:sulfur carrier protein